MTNSNEKTILYKELSYKLQGLIFDIRNDLGSGHKESIYQKALEKELIRAGIKFTKEPSIKICSKRGEFLGLYRPDFLIENKIIVELKAVEHISRQETARVYDYLRNSEFELAYLVNFASPRLFVKRLIFTNDRKRSSQIATNIKRIAMNVILFVAISSLFVGIRGVQAAETFFRTKTPEIKAGQLFEVGVFINTNEESINAIEGKIIFPQDLLEIKKINDGNSIINFWIEKPKSTPEGQMAFSGIVPGGYNDSQGLIFSITFLAKKEGNGAIEFSGVKTLRNDGKGTEAPLTISNFQFLISNPPAGKPVPQVTTPKTEDRNPPEEFTPQIAADPAIFNGKWFVVFATQDKGSGIDHYEVCEGKRKCVTAESPYLLQNQDLDEKIVVKAVDKSGNERVATIPAQKPRAWYKDYEIIAILIMAAVVYLIYKILWKKRRK